MEGDSLHRRQLDSLNFCMQGMETVVATVSGYHGCERFNLIKLISRTGASYVGNMYRSTTHLVCWKFEGKKYEFAKKFRICVVNHRWVEECVRKGRRVSEEPYVCQSGEEIGPLSLDILLRFNQATAQPHASKKKKPVIDIDFDVTYIDQNLCNENLFSQGTKQSIRRNYSEGQASRSNHCPETRSRPILLELDEVSTSLPARSSKLKKQKFNPPERHSKGRKLVKKHTSMSNLLLEDCQEVEVSPCNNSSAILSDGSHVERCQTSSRRNTSNIECFSGGQDNSDVHGAVTRNLPSSSRGNKSDIRRFLSRHDTSSACDDVEEVENEKDGNANASVDALSTLPPTSDGGGPCKDNVDVNCGDGLPTSNELSCVICWTDFSSTRGVLPCGHRFCFSCIQNWADHMVSIKKPSTCPLCKASFICITKVEDAVSSDQKIYSQSVPNLCSGMDLYILPDETNVPPGIPSESVCCRCFMREPEDLLIRCHFCRVRCVHSYCLDPPLLPWTCVHCKDLQMLYFHSR